MTTKTTNNKKQPKKLVKKVARFVAFTVLFVLATYGCRHLLDSLQEIVAYGVTAGFMLALIYILFEE